MNKLEILGCSSVVEFLLNVLKTLEAFGLISNAKINK